MKEIRSKALRIFLILYAVALFFVPGTWAEEGDVGEASFAETLLFDLINEARSNPLDVAASLGLDPEQVLEGLPQLVDILTGGLPPLGWDERLYTTAAAHTADMLEGGYYSSQSPDGGEAADRIREAGYEAVVARESLGGLTFINFMDSLAAAEKIFENMFLDELDPAREEPRHILSTYLKDLGVGIGTGKMTIEGKQYSVYLATCDFAAPLPAAASLEAVEREFLHLINQARANPLEVAAAYGIDLNALASERPDLYSLLIEGLPPVASDERLFQAAGNHSAAMAEGNFFGHESEDGTGYEDRIGQSGYDATLTGETLSRVRASDYPDPRSAAQALFGDMFKRELDPLYEGERVILHPDLEDGGVGVALGEMGSSGTWDLYYLAACDLASGDGPERSGLLGVVFEDRNGDGLYNPGEGVKDRPVIVYGAGRHLMTDENGGIQTKVDPGGYWVVLFNQTEPLQIQEIHIGEKNTWVQFGADELGSE